MSNYEYNNNIYSLPLKVTTSKSKIAWTYVSGIFLFVTVTFSLLSAIAIEMCINEGYDLFNVSTAIATAIVALFSLVTILPRRLIIYDEKIQLKCLIYKKEICWADLSSLSTNVSDVSFSARPVWDKDKNLVMHKANQTMPGFRVGIKKVELIFRKKTAKWEPLNFSYQ